MKKIPYGNCNFADIIKSGYAYVDKTRYIEYLENENNRYQLILRPRRFGKSLFLSVLDNYYDINSKDKFESFFGNLYIGKYPTPEQGTYTILRFDFSNVKTKNSEEFYKSFSDVVQEGVCRFLDRYKNIFTDTTEEIQRIKKRQMGTDSLLSAYGAGESANIPIFVIIDEYDNFANDLIVMNETYRNEVMKRDEKEGIVRTFYKLLKAGTSTVVRRIFITGVSPMMVNDLTSGFNMATDYSLIPKYNEMFGFTKDEVDWLINETKVDRNLINIDMEYYYNGYMFNNKGKNKIYNSQMILFMFNQILLLGEQPNEIVDGNLRTSYKRLRGLAGNEKNREILLNIVIDGGIYGYVTGNFSLEKLHDEEQFISFLFYLGMLTCGGIVDEQPYLKIPNYSIRTLYWEYVLEYINDLSKGTVDTSKLLEVIREMALKGDIIPYLDFFIQNYLKYFSNRNIENFDEKYIKAMMLPTLNMNNFYHPKFEQENMNGYSDIYLQKYHANPGRIFEYVLELKYIKSKDVKNEKLIEIKFKEAFAQLEKYRKDKSFSGRNDIKFTAILFKGKDKYEAREISLN